jgi:hypothetical protein
LASWHAFVAAFIDSSLLRDSREHIVWLSYVPPTLCSSLCRLHVIVVAYY